MYSFHDVTKKIGIAERPLNVRDVAKQYNYALPTSLKKMCRELSQFPPPYNPDAPGWVSYSLKDPTANHCAIDPEDDIKHRLVIDPDYNLSYRSGNAAESVNAPTLKNGHHSVGAFIHADHRQGIQRLYLDSGNLRGNYFIVSTSARGIGPGFEVIKLGNKRTSGAIGQTDGLNGHRSPPDHKIIAYCEHDNSPHPEHYNHAGGIQVMGNYLVVPLENEEDRYISAFRFANLSNPYRPQWGDLIYRQSSVPGKSIKDAGAASLTKLSNGHYMAMIFGRSSGEVEIFVSKTCHSFDMSASNWKSLGAWITGLSGGENAQLVTRKNGKLYLIATRSNSHEDWLDLYRVTLSGDLSYRPHFQKVESGSKMMYCRTSNTGHRRFCDFGAGAGPYVDSSGHIIIYSVERYAFIHIRESDGEYRSRDDGDHVGVREFVCR